MVLVNEKVYGGSN